MGLYFQKFILSQDSEEKIIHTLALCIHATDASLNSNIPNINTAGFMSMALNSVSISRLKKHFERLDKGTQKIYERLKQVSSPLGNFRDLRRLANERTSLPFMPIFAKDNVLSAAGNSRVDSLSVLGSMYRKLIDLRRQLEWMPNVSTTNLLEEISNVNVTVEEIEFLSFLAEPNLPNLSNPSYTMEELKRDLTIIKLKAIPLKIKMQDKELGESDALNELKSWLAAKSSDIKINEELLESLSDCNQLTPKQKRKSSSGTRSSHIAGAFFRVASSTPLPIVPENTSNEKNSKETSKINTGQINQMP
jgi:hypothetical protein